MERKIGEIFEYNGEWYQCVECDSCGKCSLSTTECGIGTKSDLADEVFGECSKIRRLDSKHVIFKKLEKVGEPFTGKVHIQLQRYNIYTKPIIDSAENVGYIDEGNTIAIEIKQNKEDMEEKNNGNTPLNVLTDKYVNGDICYDDFEKEVKALYSCKEEIKPTLKEFDLEAAKAGKPVCTRDGRKARIICFDKITCKNYEELKIIALIREKDNEDIHVYNNNGKKYLEDSPIDLMMLSKKESGYAKIRKDINLYNTKEEADRKMIGNDEYVTAKVCWEE